MRTLFILNDPPYGTERGYNALRLAGSLAKWPDAHVRVLLMGEGATCAHSHVEGRVDHRGGQSPCLLTRRSPVEATSL
jgi:sulfur relay (sulfurtransferase) complex TusBCD TusD component (DsrE family)